MILDPEGSPCPTCAELISDALEVAYAVGRRCPFAYRTPGGWRRIPLHPDFGLSTSQWQQNRSAT